MTQEQIRTVLQDIFNEAGFVAFCNAMADVCDEIAKFGPNESVHYRLWSRRSALAQKLGDAE